MSSTTLLMADELCSVAEMRGPHVIEQYWWQKSITEQN